MKYLYTVLFIITSTLTWAQITYNSNSPKSAFSIPGESNKPIMGKEVKAFSPPGGISNIQFVGDGNLQKSLNQGVPFAANTGLGAIFSRRWSEGDTDRVFKWIQNFELSAVINVASTADTLRAQRDATTNTVVNQRDFGTFLLLPVNSKQAANANLDVFFGRYNDGWQGKVAQVISGFNARFIGSNTNWVIDKTNRNITGMAFRFGFFHEFLGDDIRFTSNKQATIDYSIALGLYYSERRLTGDLSALSNEPIRQQIIGTTDKIFRGVEVGLTLRLKNIKAELAIPILMGKNTGTDVPGLTNTQFVTSINFTGGFPLKIGESSSR